MDDTPNLKLPYILAAQSQKHVTHNEALRALDAIVQLAVLDKDLATPPGSPGNGDRYLVAASPTAAWAGHAMHVAAWQDGAWVFYAPVAGWLAWVEDESQSYLFSGGGWIPAPGGGGASIVPRGAWSSASTYAIGDLVEYEGLAFLSNVDENIDNEPDAETPGSTVEWTYFAPVSGGGGEGGGSVNPTPLVGVNATADTTNRLKVSSPASLFDHEGAGHQLKINKDEATDTASVLFQTGYSGRAEFGLAGDDDFHVKVSPDGSAWHEALVIDRASGAVRVKSGEIDVASAGTCDIGSAAQQRVRITGTTTITSLGTGANQLRHVLFEGALTLTHNATSLILPGGANIATAAGDTATFASDGSGNWRCLAYQRADGSVHAADGTTSAPGFVFEADPNTGFIRPGTDSVAAVTGGTQRWVTDASGRILLGHTAAVTAAFSTTPSFQEHSTGAGGSTFGNMRWNNASGGPLNILAKSRGAAVGTHAIVSSGDVLGAFSFEGSDGAAFIRAASITVAVDGTPGTNDMPGRISLDTTADGGTTPTERVRITNAGAVHFPGIGTTASAANAFLDSGASPANQLLRSTSSLAWKYDVEALELERATAFLAAAQPIWYRSKAPADTFDDGAPKSFYSFGAEHLAEIDPRLATWGYRPDDWEPVIVEQKIEMRLKDGAEKVPDGINDRAVITLLVGIVQRQEQRIAALEAALGGAVRSWSGIC